MGLSALVNAVSENGGNKLSRRHLLARNPVPLTTLWVFRRQAALVYRNEEPTLRRHVLQRACTPCRCNQMEDRP
jgi:hypothetical protein